MVIELILSLWSLIMDTNGLRVIGYLVTSHKAWKNGESVTHEGFYSYFNPHGIANQAIANMILNS